VDVSTHDERIELVTVLRQIYPEMLCLMISGVKQLCAPFRKPARGYAIKEARRVSSKASAAC
jgi:hypothetical protein